MLERLGSRLAGSVLVKDLILTLFCLYGASHLRLQIQFGRDIGLEQVQLPWQLYVAAAIIWTVTFLLLSPQRALFRSSLSEALGRLVAAVALASLTFAGLLYLSFRDVSRLQFLYFAGSDLLALFALHLFVHSYTRFRGNQGSRRRVLLVGSGPIQQQLQHEFARRPWAGMDVVGCASDEPLASGDVPLLGPIDATSRIVVEHHIDEVIFATPPQQQDRVIRLSLELQRQSVMLHMVPSVLDLAFARTPVETVGGIPLISLRESALTPSQRVFKRLLDVVGSTLLLVLSSPLLLCIAIAIRIETPGPAFLLQERIGEQGRRFKMLKFRSMCADAEERWSEVARRQANGQLMHKWADDPRVTRLGRMLRRTSLDELPQLINVLRGEMSLVGPRPELPYLTAEYAPWQWQRFRVPAGLTGWWQVNGRSGKPMHLHTEDDLYYIQNYSFWMDLKILCLTVGAVLKGRGAF